MGTKDGRLGPYVTAAIAAQRRADQCRCRCAELRTGTLVSGPDDVAGANQHLTGAIDRARIAEGRLAESIRLHRFNQALRQAGICPVKPVLDLPPRLDHESDSNPLVAELVESVATGTAAVLDLWIAFAEYGGEASYFEFDGYVNGAWAMSAPDRQVLSQVCWEQAKFGRAEP